MSDHTIDEEIFLLNNIIETKDDEIKDLYIQISMLEKQLDDRKPAMRPNSKTLIPTMVKRMKEAMR